ncbi:hypothetical protein [Deinococcus roseus]|uniref:Uncharacterized protein n=1 Tax=Deinococcus roseus TaxID=392414 RepID=A0ABQ2D3F2_9DEIO|nr:hypothetical protein [Deinococcus roseus]GGJ43715.1 hypothetical protein GCM10008938_32510 [Deinococcus roseus]
MPSPDLSSLTLKKRHARWLVHYPHAEFWKSWHMPLLGHGGILPTAHDTHHMRSLYRTNQLQSPAADLLLSFERRTLIGHLPRQTSINRVWLQHILEQAVRKQLNLWDDVGLQEHYRNHSGPDELPTLNETAAALRVFAQQKNLPQHLIVRFFPKTVQNEIQYGQLALAILFSAMLTDDPGFKYYLYCPFPPDHHILSLNIEVPETWLHHHGATTWRVVRLGLNLALSEEVHSHKGEPLNVPVLLPHLRISTLFTASQGMVSRQLNLQHLCSIRLSN